LSAEAYLKQLPALADPELAADLIYSEILLRERAGQQLASDEYLRRFPQFAEALRLQFAVHEALPAEMLGQPPTGDTVASDGLTGSFLTSAERLAQGVQVDGVEQRKQALQLVAGVGLDYALFFARRQLDEEERARTLRTLTTCNAMTLLSFGLLLFRRTPVLHSIGATVAIGAALAAEAELKTCVAGIEVLMKASAGLPFDLFFVASSCVPATKWEHAGATLGPAEVLGGRCILLRAGKKNYGLLMVGDPT